MTVCSTPSLPGGRGARLRKTWNRRHESWHEHVSDSDAFGEVRAAVAEAAGLSGTERVVDLGAGGGFLTLELAPLASTVLAVDISETMLERLRASASTRGIANVEARTADLATLHLPYRSVDVIVSNYALHHLTDSEKSALLVRAHAWLRPGGRLVVADMMFGRGGSARDRRILATKVLALARKGPGGVWRIVKNLVRFGLRLGTERPAPPEFWCRSAEAAGFGAVQYRSIAGEAGMLTAVAAGRGDDQQPPTCD